MPVIDSNYRPPFWLKSGHLQSIYPTLFRPPFEIAYMRERLELSDGDFVDMDWSKTGSKRLVILSHGLEGNSSRTYITAMVSILNSIGWDCLAWNFRSCSGQMNRLLRFYHNGDIADLATVISNAESSYDQIVLIGFSMGGNVTLNYLSRFESPSRKIIKAIVFSVPCDLKGSCDELAKAKNFIYLKRFLIKLKEKIVEKEKQFPNKISSDHYSKIKNFEDFDNRYTAPLHGFKNAQDYWEKGSSLPHLNQISIPTYMINAKNDPFLSDSCYPIEIADANPNLYLEMPASGGHVGFIEFNQDRQYWSERRVLDLLSNSI
ncbi:MAG: alpha/beta fold hydrolase [Calditrichaeota bacterium]|nr:alpha/beta fold hydrolase [Calditrichota bacterium]